MTMRDTDLIEKVVQKLADKIKPELDEEIEKLEGKYTDLQNKNLEITDRLEELECKKNSPGKTSAWGEDHLPYKTYHTKEGKIFEIPHNIKLADVLPPPKQAPVSFERWLGAFAGGERCKDRQAVEYAREIKALTTATTGTLIPQEYISEWIDKIRSQMVLNQAGMTTVTMQDKIQNSSAVVTDPAATWHTEAGAISVGDPTFSPRTLTAQTLVTRCQASLEITQDSPDFGKQLADVMARAMAVEVDQTGLIGSGTSPEPRGIKNTSGISTVASGGVMTDFSKLLAAVKKLLDANVPVEIAALNVIMSPGIWNRLESLVTGISGDKTQLSRPKALENTKFLVTSNGLDTGSPPTSTLFLGDFRDLVLGVRAEASIEALKVTNYPGNLLIDFIGYLRCDFMVRRPTSFCTITGATPL